MEHQLVRLGVFFDAPNHSMALDASGMKMNYIGFLSKIRRKHDLVQARYYTGISSDPNHQKVRDFIETLSKHGYVIVSKPVLIMPDGRIKANLDVEIAVDMITMSPRLDKIMLFSGDGDFTYAVDTLQRSGLHVTIVSHKPMVSSNLRFQADEFLELTDFIRRLPKEASNEA